MPAKSSTKLASLEIGTSDRILIVGGPKDGKTTLAFNLLARVDPDRTVVINPGQEKVYYDVFGPSRPTVDTTFPKVQHVSPPLYEDKKDYDRIWWPIVMEGNVFFLNDEVSITSTASQFGPGMTYSIQQARRRNCGSISITQRYRRIPTFLTDLADHIIVGYVQGEDLKRLERDTQRSWSQIMASWKQHQFAYWSKHHGGDPIILGGGETVGQKT